MGAHCQPRSGDGYFDSWEAKRLIQVSDDDHNGEVALPHNKSEWIKATNTAIGQAYYYNLATGASSWMRQTVDSGALEGGGEEGVKAKSEQDDTAVSSKARRTAPRWNPMC